MYVPRYMFLTKGVGVSEHKLASFESALRAAGIAPFNLVKVSSILPPKCKILSRDEGIKRLSPGQIVHVVMADISTNEPGRLISAAIGVAIPRDKSLHGYLSEHHAFGETDEKSGRYAEELAATMLATTLGIDISVEGEWKEKKKAFVSSGHIFKTSHISQSARGNKDGLWTTVIAAAVLIP